MKNCFNPFRRLIGSCLLLAGLASCVDTDFTFGEEYIPGDHHMKIALDSTFRVKTYNVTVDSTIASLQPLNLLGSYRNPQTGVSINAGIVFEMQSALNFSNLDSLFGTNPVIDSALFTFIPSSYVGNSGVEQVFDLYELEKRISIDSIYYYDFDPAPYIGPEPLFTFNYTWEEGASMRFRIDDPAFLARLADTTGYWRDSLFKERFKGFYITPRTAHTDAALYNIFMSSPSRLIAYYHNDEKPDTALSVYYSFAPYNGYNPKTLNQTINVVDRDYSGVFPEIALNEPKAVPLNYVEGFGGILTRLEFTEGSIQALKEKARAAGYRDVAVNKALLRIAYPTRDPDQWDQLPSRLGIYVDFAQRIGIPDYNWRTEMSAIMQEESYYLAYGGYINRSLFFYEMDITSYVQRLMQDNYDKREVYLGPSYESIMTVGYDNWHNESTTVVSGSESENPVDLVITYTMIR
jgi:hypothetical protein